MRVRNKTAATFYLEGNRPLYLGAPTYEFKMRDTDLLMNYSMLIHLSSSSTQAIHLVIALIILPTSLRERQHKASDRLQESRRVCSAVVAVVKAEGEGRGTLPAIHADQAAEVSPGFRKDGSVALACREDMC